eukprot:TRINITY_DN47206_c0_g1_i1.p1 TRINITY_DN47206_c0_g1~~TRINITY_DN47206_c0_g1_i1.p1  ORF type:complete len:588 (+),score=159.83 TRINITY_DN47206_c0_g1_i1:80-1765(+)
MREVSYAELSKHNTGADLWTAIHGRVYDLTTYASTHPGGAAILSKYAGRDATEEFKTNHPEDIIKRTLPDGGLKHLVGVIDPKTIPDSAKGIVRGKDSVDVSAPIAGDKVDLSALINVYDFEAAAQREMLSSGRKKGWDYYSSGADDEMTLRENHSAFQRVWLKPRVMVDVSRIDTSCKILGHESSSPIYLSAVALQKLGHSEGELGWVRGAARTGSIFMVPTLSSCSFRDILDARVEGQTLFFQLYVNPNRGLCEDLVKSAEAAGITALFITVDAPQLGRRERDMRNKAGTQAASVQASSSAEMGKRREDKGTSGALTSFIDPSLSWDDVAWFRSITKMKIVLKGVQTGSDAVKAAESGVDGIVVSNHGGRQLDFARSGIEILPEVMQALHQFAPGTRMEVFVDGGVRRGTDVFKALALGAKAVGIGKPLAYANAAYGADGVERCMEMLAEELRNAMRLCGCTSIADITPNHVDARFLDNHAVLAPLDALAAETYIRLQTAQAIREAAAPPPPPSVAQRPTPTGLLRTPGEKAAAAIAVFCLLLAWIVKHVEIAVGFRIK